MHTHHSANVRYHPLPGSAAGVVEIVWSGVLTRQAVRALWGIHNEHTQHAPALVVRLDTGISAYGGAGVVTVEEMAATPPSALVVSPVQYVDYKRFTGALAGTGALRAVFLPTQLRYAAQWAEDHAQAGIRRLIALRLHKPESDFAPL